MSATGQAQPFNKRPKNGRNDRGQFAGQAGPGRKKGVPNRATAEARAVCAKIVNDPAYRKTLTQRARAGTLAPATEAMLWHYAFGKPKELFEHSGPEAGPITIVNEILPPLSSSGGAG